MTAFTLSPHAKSIVPSSFIANMLWRFALVVASAAALRPVASRRAALVGGAASVLVGGLAPAVAISGGGKDYAEADLRGADFSGQTLNSKDFSGADGVDAVFAKAKLRGARFFKADMERADFSGADLTSASLEGCNLTGASLRGAVAEGAAFSKTIADAGDIRDVDFTDAVIQPYTQKELCGRDDASGTNPATGVGTRDSLFCP